MKAWGFNYKSNIVWHKVRKDGGSDGRGVGFYFRNVTELILFGVRGKNARTLAPGRSQVNFLRPASASIRASPMNNTRLSRRASPGRSWSYSLAARGRAGRLGQSGRRGLSADVEDVCEPFASIDRGGRNSRHTGAAPFAALHVGEELRMAQLSGILRQISP